MTTHRQNAYAYPEYPGHPECVERIYRARFCLDCYGRLYAYGVPEGRFEPLRRKTNTECDACGGEGYRIERSAPDWLLGLAKSNDRQAEHASANSEA